MDSGCRISKELGSCLLGRIGALVGRDVGIRGPEGRSLERGKGKSANEPIYDHSRI